MQRVNMSSVKPLGLVVVLIIGVATAISGCSVIRFPGVYRIDVGQGNLITQDMMAKLKLGMSPRQVEFVMGSAMIQDPFHPGRWDYFYSLQTGSGIQAENRLTLYFENGRLARIDDSRYRDPKTVKREFLERQGKAPPPEEEDAE